MAASSMPRSVNCAAYGVGDPRFQSPARGAFDFGRIDFSLGRASYRQNLKGAFKMQRILQVTMNIRGLISKACALALCGLSFAAYGADRENDSLVSARQKFFGAENVDAATGAVRKDKVIFTWATTTTIPTSVLGRVILLDTFVFQANATPGRTPFVVQDLIDLRPEAIFLGHGHFDHADNAAYIAKTLDIPIYASAETCNIMEMDAAYYFGAGATVKC